MFHVEHQGDGVNCRLQIVSWFWMQMFHVKPNQREGNNADPYMCSTWNILPLRLCVNGFIGAGGKGREPQWPESPAESQ
jgi:hypothetical protein